MKRNATLVLAALATVVTLGCTARQTYRLPPRIDLTQHEMIGVIEFDSSSARELGPLVTQRFTELARQDQGLVRMVEFGPQDEALRAVGSEGLSSQAFQALGREHGVRTILVGRLTVSDVRPDLRIASGLRSGSLSALVDATLAVQLIEASSGASIWNGSARATQSVGHISVFDGGEFVFDADDPERAYGGLIDSLVVQATRDFRVRWERR